jgi:putative FmdB family regulatory protein
MPTYEYACRDCGEHVEVVQSFKDAALTTCGVCGGRLRKVFSAAGIIFKGSGYYVTDSRGGAGARKGGGEKPASGGGDSDGGSGSSAASSSESSSSTAESA